MKTNYFPFGFGLDVKVWCGLCILANLSAILFYNKYLLSNVISLLIIILYVYLLKCKRRVALYAIALLHIVPAFLVAIVIIRSSIPLAIILLIWSMVGPFLTYIVLRRYWKHMN